MIRLIPITHEPRHLEILHTLLTERTPEQSISHRGMPTKEEHEAFVRSHPYAAWYLIHNGASGYVGSVYISKQREIGVFIFNAHRGKGYGKAAVRMLMEKHPGRWLANISPKNTRSMRFFNDLGFRPIQTTLEKLR